MKKTITITIPEVKYVPQHEKEKEVTVCDICGDKIDGRICDCCLCSRQTHNIWDSPLKEGCGDGDPDDPADYPDWYCKHCYSLRFVIRKDIYDKIRSNYENALEKANEMIKEESLKITIK